MFNMSTKCSRYETSHVANINLMFHSLADLCLSLATDISPSVMPAVQFEKVCLHWWLKKQFPSHDITKLRHTVLRLVTCTARSSKCHCFITKSNFAVALVDIFADQNESGEVHRVLYDEIRDIFEKSRLNQIR
jgi:hypothetical protein